jgi:hypothetical protein
MLGAGLVGHAFVFSLRPDGTTPWKPNWVTKRFITARRAAGLPHFRLHDLRHFMATQMLAAGVPIATVSQRLSHARASTTLNVYAHFVPGGDRKAAETLAGILDLGRRQAQSSSHQRRVHSLPQRSDLSMVATGPSPLTAEAEDDADPLTRASPAAEALVSSYAGHRS